MTENNPYAPPQAPVEDLVEAVVPQKAPPLWNPGAAASWSLFFSPVFGSLVHMKNWQAMGEPLEAQRSKRWAIGSLAFFFVFTLLSALMPDSKAVDGLGRLAAFVLLVSWYYVMGKRQSAVVLYRYGKHYPRRGWLKPLSLALLGFVGFIVGAVLIGVAIGTLMGALQP